MTVRLEDVTQTVMDGPDPRDVLSIASLEFVDGHMTVVMGPSGSGKTTLAMLLAGVDVPSQGSVWFHDMDITRLSARKRAQIRRHHIGVVFQDDELDPLLDVVENVALPLRLNGMRQREARARAEQALAACGVPELAQRHRNELSGGQRQRVAIARAIAGERRLIVADEPTAALDSVATRQIAELLHALARSGLTVVVTTHDPHLAGYADETVLLRDGRIANRSDSEHGGATWDR